ncbi:DapH/DapD/GlmU-related protein [Agreia sp. COWG]|uniref:acyltransferase n=1 Tax=Agreia sp. COWG TaxID=2773266 RepID=UPI00192760E1|nr:acyltransferase [Agreia sp. COWG]
MGEQRYANRPWNLCVNLLASSAFLTGGVREMLYRRGGIDPNGTQIRPGVWFFSSKITFGQSGMINSGCYFENREQITIGARCFFGPQTMIGTSTHEIGDHDQRAGDYVGGPVVIGDGCWIGARATILPGVNIAPGCIIAAGSVVAADTAPDGLYAGVPAVRKKDL